MTLEELENRVRYLELKAGISQGYTQASEEIDRLEKKLADTEQSWKICKETNERLRKEIIEISEQHQACRKRLVESSKTAGKYWNRLRTIHDIADQGE